MFRYKLRTLLIVLALGPPVLAGAWFVASRVAAEYRSRQIPMIKTGGGGVAGIPARRTGAVLVPSDE